MGSQPLGLTSFTQHNDKFYGNYRGLVEDNVDPDKLGRVKIRVYPMFNGITTISDIPWAIPAYPIWVGAGENIGYFAVPDIGTLVYVFFEEGDIYQPVYFAEAPDAIKGLPAHRITNYPNRRISRTHAGIEKYTDDTQKKVDINFTSGMEGYFDATDKKIYATIPGSSSDDYISATLDRINKLISLRHNSSSYLKIFEDGSDSNIPKLRYVNPLGSYAEIKENFFILKDLIAEFDHGANIASNTTITLGNDGNFFTITGTTNISTITAKRDGTFVFLKFTGSLNILNSGNIQSASGGFSTQDGATLTLICDGTNWIEIARTPTELSGKITMWGGSSASIPAGYLACDGSEVSRTTYASLFTAIGTTWGSTGGSTFTLPNFINVFPIGAGGLAAAGSRNEAPGTNGGLTGSDNALHYDLIGTDDNGTTGTPRALKGNNGTPGNGDNIIMPYAAVPFIIKT